MDFPGVAVSYSKSQIPGAVLQGDHPAIYRDSSMFSSSSNDAEYSEMHSVLADGSVQFGVSALCFDNMQELLWMGNQGGHITSYYGLDLQKYTSFQVHASNDIRQVLTVDTGGLFLTRNDLRCSMRRGRTQFDYTSNYMQDMQCMLMTSDSSVLLGGHQTEVIELDLTKVEEIRQVDVTEPGCAIFRASNKFICAGDTSGKVTLFDPNTMNVEHTLDAHTGTLSDFDIHGNLLVTCGYSNRMGTLSPDRYLMVYDIRVMRAMAPIKLMVEPTFLRFVSAYTNRLCVVSQVGHFQLIETAAMTPASMMLYQVNTQGGVILSFDISSTCQALAFGDSSGYIHLFATSGEATFNAFSEATEFCDPVEPLTPMHINDELTPFSLIPITYPNNNHLLSDWSDFPCKKVYRKRKPIDPEILRTMKMRHNVGYAQNPGKERRNQVAYDLTSENSWVSSSCVAEGPVGRVDNPLVNIPKRYRKVELKYSKLGLEDFDFRQYNKTNFAGLETQIPNAYCNSMLQVLYFIEPLRSTFLSHLCEKEFCLACELGFLFHMLDEQKGQTCQATNFLRTFRTIPEASALGLVLGDQEESHGKVNWIRLIQNWHRFIHQQLHSETYIKEIIQDEWNAEKRTEEDQTDTCEKENKKENQDDEKALEKSEGDSDQADFKDVSIISKLFGIEMVTVLKCQCGQETQRNTATTLTNLSYLNCSVQLSFTQVLQRSMKLEQVTQAWCNICKKYQPHTQRKVLKTLPDVLAINCQIESPQDMEFLKTQLQHLKKYEGEPEQDVNSPQKKLCRYGKSCKRKDCFFRHAESPEISDVADLCLGEDAAPSSWIPLGLRLVLSKDGITVSEVDPETTSVKDKDTKEYEIFATVSHIKDAKTGGNIVSQMKVGETYHQRKENVTCTQWYLFNDFSITPIEMVEALQFNLEWKLPCIIYFLRKDLNSYYNLKVQNPITSSALFVDTGLINPKRRKLSFKPLTADDRPKAGDIVALDAEFVSLNQEEAELKSDGTRFTLKPSHLALARITCIRGYGPLCGESFLDDYISMQEQVVDYLTEYSGIKPDDLIASVSTKHLTTLKSTYQKLRYLVDAGVCFVGHGLKKDFRVINIYVPKKQVIDTVELLHLPRQRNISLKFLAWYFFKISIQSFTHDSVEDARMALKLYTHYQELCKEGDQKPKTVIKEMYENGRKMQWKIPQVDDMESPYTSFNG